MENENLAATVARESRKPFAVSSDTDIIAVPDGWTMEDTEKYGIAPRRKHGKMSFADEASFVAYVKVHGSLATCTIWCDADYQKGRVSYKAILNDHRTLPEGQQWRDHIAQYTPEKSVEWETWMAANGESKKMRQLGFALFIEENMRDIATMDGYPTGSAMLQMATNLEITQDSQIKSAVRLQNGGVNVSYVDDANAETVKSMEVFSKFCLGLPVFRSGTAYPLEARLRYRLSQGKLAFWYELNRPDQVLESAAKNLTASIKSVSGFPMYHGNPFAA